MGYLLRIGVRQGFVSRAASAAPYPFPPWDQNGNGNLSFTFNATGQIRAWTFQNAALRNGKEAERTIQQRDQTSWSPNPLQRTPI